MKHLFKTSLLALVAIAMAALSSCSSKEMLDRVPSDVDFVIVGNLDQLIKNAGFEVTDNDIKGPSDLKAALNSIPNDARETIGALHSSINCNRMVVMGYFSSNPEVVGMAQITDNDLLTKTLRNELDADRSTIKGLEVYELPGHSYIVTDNAYAYICDARSADDAASTINKFINRAQDKDITSIHSVADVISQDNTLNIVCNTNSIADLMNTMSYSYLDTQSALAMQTMLPYLKGNWLGITGNYTGTELTVEAYLFNEESGKKVEYPGLKDVDTSVLKFLPSNTIASAAVGIDNETLKKNLKQLEKMGGNDRMVKELVDQLGNIDGTVAIGLGVSSEEQMIDFCVDGLMKADVTLVAQMREGKASEFKDYLVNMVNMFGLKAENVGNATKLVGRNFECYLMVKDGNFIVSTKPTAAEADNATIKMLAGVNSGVAVNVPSISKLIGGQSKAGIEGSMIFKDNTMTLNIKALGTDNNLHGAIMGLGADFNAFDRKLNEAWDKKFQEMYGSYNYYDSYNGYDTYAEAVDSVAVYDYDY